MTMELLRALDLRIARLSGAENFALAACGVLIIGGVDFVTGYEISMSLFYLGPVAMAAWYAGRWTGFAIAVLSCMTWYAAELAAGSQYSHPAIPIWNALVRFGFFFITGMLVVTLRNSLRVQQYLARTDGLTGVYGRRAFEDRLQHDLALAQRHGSALTLAYVDLDDFKVLNDTLGHAEGDLVLRVVGRVLRGSVREADTAARLGGDEFALVLPEASLENVRLRAEDIRMAIRDLDLAHNGVPLGRVTASLGIALFPDHVSDPESLMHAADAALYEAKNAGRDRAVFCPPGRFPPPPARQITCS